MHAEQSTGILSALNSTQDLCTDRCLRGETCKRSRTTTYACKGLKMTPNSRPVLQMSDSLYVCVSWFVCVFVHVRVSVCLCLSVSVHTCVCLSVCVHLPVPLCARAVGVLLHESGDEAALLEARELYDKCLSVDPSNDNARLNLQLLETKEAPRSIMPEADQPQLPPPPGLEHYEMGDSADSPPPPGSGAELRAPHGLEGYNDIPLEPFGQPGSLPSNRPSSTAPTVVGTASSFDSTQTAVAGGSTTAIAGTISAPHERPPPYSAQNNSASNTAAGQTVQRSAAADILATGDELRSSTAAARRGGIAKIAEVGFC